MEKIYTIGVYGTSEIDFFKTLLLNRIDLFCDIRQRRGVRGKKYSYVNSTYLQNKLKEYDIDYLHYKSLAPTTEIREAQYEADKINKVAKRDRTVLGEAFTQAYQNEILSSFDTSEFVEKTASYKRICLFCVECLPSACHRSLVAVKLSNVLTIATEHLTPCQKLESS